MENVIRNKMKLMISMLILGLFTLIGCTQEPEFDSFSLEQIGLIDAEDTENPTLYIVSHKEANDKVTIIRNQIIDEGTIGSEDVQYDLEDTSVTDEEIVIEYEGKEEKIRTNIFDCCSQRKWCTVSI